MRKFLDVDIIDALGAIMERNTKHYQSDFEYDKTRLLEAAASTIAEDKALIWMSRDSGTWCAGERDSLIDGSEANIIWHNHEGENVLDFSVTILDTRDGRPVGNLYQLDYEQHLQLLKRAALPIEAATLTFADGSEKCYPYKEVRGNWQGIQQKQGSKITDIRYEIQDESVLQSRLEQERRLRDKYPARSLNAFLKNLSGPVAKPSVTEKLAAAKAEAAKQAAPKKSAPAKSKGAEL